MLTEQDKRRAKREAARETWLVRIVIATIVIAAALLLLYGIQQDTQGPPDQRDDPSFYWQDI